MAKKFGSLRRKQFFLSNFLIPIPVFKIFPLFSMFLSSAFLSGLFFFLAIPTQLLIFSDFFPMVCLFFPPECFTPKNIGGFSGQKKNEILSFLKRSFFPPNIFFVALPARVKKIAMSAARCPDFIPLFKDRRYFYLFFIFPLILSRVYSPHRVFFP